MTEDTAKRLPTKTRIRLGAMVANYRKQVAEEDSDRVDELLFDVSNEPLPARTWAKEDSPDQKLD